MSLAPAPAPKSAAPAAHDHHHDHAHDHQHYHDHGHHHAPKPSGAPGRLPFSFFRASTAQLFGLAALVSASLWLTLFWAMA
jgi:ABC-type Zn2+ transport system substrate-binding protein/surface adhesin